MSGRAILIEVCPSTDTCKRAGEGLRAAVALAAGAEGHQVRVLLRGRSARWATCSAPAGEHEPCAMLAYLLAFGVCCAVSDAVLAEPRLEVDSRVQVIPAQDLQAWRDACPVSLSYADT